MNLKLLEGLWVVLVMLIKREIMQYIIIGLCVLSFLGCSLPQKELKIPKTSVEIQGVSNISQDVSFYANKIHRGYIASLEEYKKNYYREWHTTHPFIKASQASWANKVFHSPHYYGENFQKVTDDFYTHLRENTNFKNYATLNKKAYTLRRVNVRALPTQRMLFLNPSKAGEGFPFDYLQNSSLAAYKPIFVSHYSQDRAWVFIESSFVAGWVKRSDIAFIDTQSAKMWENSIQNIVIQDAQAIYGKDSKFLFYSQIGQMLPSNHHLFTAPDVLHRGLLPFNKETIEMILSQLQNNIYGWGGMYGQRDCSATIRDFFAPFGIWLPRNSSQQAKIGEVISFDGMDDRQKIDTIKKYAIPFETLLYKKGHIVLYVGTFNNNVIIFHNTWGVKTSLEKKEGRYIIGKPIFSTLDFGQNLKGYKKENSILHHLQSMNIVTAK